MSQPLADTAIEITADGDPFERDLDQLEKRTKRRKITAPVAADTRTMLRDIDQALSGLRGDVDLDANTRELVAQLDTALAGVRGEVDLDPDVTRLVREVDAALAGMKFDVPVEPKIGPLRDEKGRFIKAGERAGSGFGDGFDRTVGKRFTDSIRKIDKDTGTLGLSFAKSFGKATAGGVTLIGALNQISGLVVALAPVAAAGAAVLPGVFLAWASALAVVHVALIGVGDALTAAAAGDADKFKEAIEGLAPAAQRFAIAARDVIDGLRPLQQAMQNAFFAGLAPQVTRVGAAIRGLRDDAVSASLGFGRAASEVLRFAASSTAMNAVRSALGGVRDFLYQLLPAINPLLTGFASLAGQAGVFGGTLGGSVAAALTTFGQFLQGVDLGAVFAAALPTLQALGQLLGNVGGIAASVFSAAGASGTGLLGTLADLTETLGYFLTTAQGAAGLESLFAAVGQIGSALGGAFGAVLPQLATGIAALAPALGPLAQVLASVIGAIAPLLPVVGQLAGVLGGALTSAIGPLVPLISGLATLLSGSLGSLAPLLADLGATIGAILAPAASMLGDLFTQLAPVIAELGGTLGSLLAPLLAVLGPLFAQLVGALMPLLPALLSILPPVIQIVVALMPLIELLAALLTVVVQIVAPILGLAASLVALLASKAVAPLVGLITQALVFLLSPVTRVTEGLGQLSAILSSIDWAGVGAAISGAFAAAWQAVLDFFTGLGAWFAALPGQIAGFLASLPGLIAGAFRMAFDAALMAVGIGIGVVIFTITTLPGLIMNALANLTSLLGGLITRSWAAAISATTAGAAAIVTHVTGLPGRIGTGLSKLGSIVGNLFTTALSNARNAVVSGLAAVYKLFSDAPGKIISYGARFLAAGSSIVRNLVDGLKRVPSLGSIASAISGAITSQINNIIGRINSGIAAVDSKLPGSLPRIPMLARGAIVDKPTLALIGEEAREVVIPLTRPARARQLAAESGLDRILTGGASTSPITVGLRVYLGDREITDIVRFEVDRQLDDTAAQLDAGVRTL